MGIYVPCATDCYCSLAQNARPKIWSQRSTAVTSVTQITDKHQVFLCRLQLINQQSERLAENANENSVRTKGQFCCFCDRDQADAGVVPWAGCICRLQIRLASLDFADMGSRRLSAILL